MINHEFTEILRQNYPIFIPTITTPGSSVYHKLFHSDKPGKSLLFDIIKNYNLEERCQLYFSNVEMTDDLIVNPHEYLLYDKFDYMEWDEYQSESINILNGEFGPEYTVTKKDMKKIKKDFKASREKIAKHEQTLHDYFTHVKVFNKCFIDKDSAFIADQKQILSKVNWKDSYLTTKNQDVNYDNLEAKVYPWLTRKSPHFELLTTTSEVIEFDFDPNNFLLNYKETLNGKGIVLTISDSHVDDCVRLIHLLRYLGNTLPIEIIYTEGTLSDESKLQIRGASTSQSDQNYPVQDVTLINVSPAIDSNYKYKFEKFGNKILAVLFNSFEEIILIDADTILTKPPDFFFELEKYKQSGTLFYRDRNTAEFRSDYDIKLFLLLMNSHLDEKLFGLSQISEKTMSMPAISQKISHVMESGLVLINRKLHFTQPLVMANLNFFSPIAEKLYGDKEMFWLSLSIMGDENYEFDNLPAAAIGDFTPYEERINNLENPPKEFKSQELCSNHPAHINDEDDHTLLWFNSGFKFCNQGANVDFEAEFTKGDRFTNLKTLEQFQAFWENKLEIKYAMVPPKNAQTDDEYLDEPNKAWQHMGQYCGGYTWCAYSSIGNSDDPDDKGFIIKFTPDEIEHFNKLGEVWMHSYNYLDE
ncbi:MNN14 putative alpha-1 [Candida maltosa Xu316]